MSTDQRDITLTIGETDLIFTLAPQGVTKYFHAVNPNKKVGPVQLTADHHGQGRQPGGAASVIA